MRVGNECGKSHSGLTVSASKLLISLLLMFLVQSKSHGRTYIQKEFRPTMSSDGNNSEVIMTTTV